MNEKASQGFKLWRLTARELCIKAAEQMLQTRVHPLSAPQTHRTPNDKVRIAHEITWRVLVRIRGRGAF